MSTLVQDNLSQAAAGAKPAKAAHHPRAKHPWRRVWQIPLMVAGLFAFGLGVRTLLRTIKPVPFETQVLGLRQLVAAGEFDKAIEQINDLGEYYREPNQQAQLQILAGDAHYWAQQQQPVLVRSNYEHLTDHYRKALLLGAAPTPEVNERWGEAALALGDPQTGIEKLEAAIAADPARLNAHVRDLVAAFLDPALSPKSGGLTRAEEVLNRLLEQEALDVDDRVWALCKKIELALLHRPGGEGAEGGGGTTRSIENSGHTPPGGDETLKKLLQEARQSVQQMTQRDPSGRVLVWIGRAEFEAGMINQASEDLVEARSRFVVHHLDDGRAVVLLGRIAQVRGQLESAAALFQEAITAHAGTTIWPAARLGRAEVAASQGPINDQVKADYRFAVKSVTESARTQGMEGAARTAPELISTDALRESLVAQYQRSARENHLDDALMFLTLQQEMGEPETAATAFRLATSREARADQFVAQAAKAPEKSREDLMNSARTLYAQAAEDYLRHSRLSTLDDTAYGNSLWKAAELFDKAGKSARSIAIYEQFSIQRPRDPRTPEGLLATGRLYLSMGLIDKAIPVFRRNLAENPRTPAAYASAVNLARCYMAQAAAADPAGPVAKEAYDKAEQLLLALVQSNEDLRPEAREFRTSLFTLGELYYRHKQWKDAILRLDEAIQRYPEDPGIPRALFMEAESFRHSALDIADALRNEPAIARRDDLEKARMDRLLEAARLFSRVIGLLDVESAQFDAPPQGTASLTPLELEYLRTSYMDRAQCYFARGEYAQSIKMYDQAAVRFPNDVLAVEACIQIINAATAQQDSTQAAAAAERARWILKRIPDEAFGKGALALSRGYYEKLLADGKN